MNAPPPAKRARPPALDAAVSTVAVPGLGQPNGLFVLADGTLLACAGNSIRVLSPSGLLYFLAGSNTSSGNQDGPGADARFDCTMGITVDPAGNVVVVDSRNHALRLVSKAGAVSTLAGGGGAQRRGRPGLSLIIALILAQAIAKGFFHADLHQGNLFVIPPGFGRDGGVDHARIGVIDFGIMGRINRRARLYLAEILHGLVTGNYARVAEIHFEAGYVPPHHNPAAFATALRAVGEPIRGRQAKDIAITDLLEGLFSITRSFDMPVQPHLLLLQKTMVMVEGVALTIDPHVNMWEVAEPYVRNWVRDEMGPEAVIADRLVLNARALSQLPRIFRQWVAENPMPGAAPPQAPLPPLPEKSAGGWSTPWLLLAAGLGAAAAVLLS
jgi:hypothetical protein